MLAGFSDLRSSGSAAWVTRMTPIAAFVQGGRVTRTVARVVADFHSWSGS